MERAQPHEYSLSAALYHANIRKSIKHKKMQPQAPRHQDCQCQYFSLMFFLDILCPINHVASVFSSEIFMMEKKKRSLFFCPIRVGLKEKIIANFFKYQEQASFRNNPEVWKSLE